MPNLGDASAQKALRDSDDREQALEDAHLLEVMRTGSGRRVIYRLVFLECLLESPSYRHKARDTAYLEGRRGVGIELRDRLLRVCPDLWVLMVEEALARARTVEAARGQPVFTHPGDNTLG